MRRAWGCDCDGERMTGCWPDTEVNATVYRIEALTGTRPVGCPWAALSDPLVADVMKLWAARNSGAAQALLGPAEHAPHILAEALALFERTVNRCESERIRHETKRHRRESERRDTTRPLRGPKRKR